MTREQLYNLIDQYIKANGDPKITGPVLNNVLKSIIDFTDDTKIDIGTVNPVSSQGNAGDIYLLRNADGSITLYQRSLSDWIEVYQFRNNDTVAYQNITDVKSGAINKYPKITDANLPRAVQTIKTSQTKRIVIIGSSTASGVGASSESKSWPGLFAAKMATFGYNVINSAISGDSTGGNINRFFSDVAVYKPDFVILGQSINNSNIHADVAGGFNDYVNNTLVLIKLVEDIGAIPVIGAQQGNNNYTADSFKATKDAVATLERTGVYMFDAIGTTADEDSNGHWYAGLSDDGLHPNDAGHKLIFESIPFTFFNAVATQRVPKKSKPASWRLNALGSQGAIKIPLASGEYGSFSVGAWMKGSIIVGGVSMIGFSLSSGNVVRLRDPGGDGSGIQFVIDGNTDLTSGYIPTGITFNDNKWHHIAITFNSYTKKLRLYIDGSLNGTITTAINWTTLNGISWMSRYDGTFGFVGGEIKEPFFYRITLNQEDVTKLLIGSVPQKGLEFYSDLNTRPGYYAPNNAHTTAKATIDSNFTLVGSTSNTGDSLISGQEVRDTRSNSLNVYPKIIDAGLQRAVQTIKTTLTKRIVIFGSASTSGTGASASGKSWAALFAAKMSSLGYVVINSAVQNDTTAGSTSRFFSDVAVYKPDFVILAHSIHGSNINADVTTGYTDFLTSTLALVKLVEDIGAIPVLGPQHASNNYTTDSFKATKDVLASLERTGVYMLDALCTTADEANNGHWHAGLSDDGVNPNDAGHQQIYESIPVSFFNAVATQRAPKKSAPATWKLNAASSAGGIRIPVASGEYGSFSVGAWIRGVIPTGGVSVIHFNFSSGNVVRIKDAGGDAGEIQFQIDANTDTSVGFIPTQVTFNDRSWHHLTITYNKPSNKLRFYVDSELKGTITPTLNWSFLTGISWMGRYDGTFSFVGGFIKEPFLYRTSLNQEGIHKLVIGSMPNQALEFYSDLNSKPGYYAPNTAHTLIKALINDQFSLVRDIYAGSYASVPTEVAYSQLLDWVGPNTTNSNFQAYNWLKVVSLPNQSGEKYWHVFTLPNRKLLSFFDRFNGATAEGASALLGVNSYRSESYLIGSGNRLLYASPNGESLPSDIAITDLLISTQKKTNFDAANISDTNIPTTKAVKDFVESQSTGGGAGNGAFGTWNRYPVNGVNGVTLGVVRIKIDCLGVVNKQTVFIEGFIDNEVLWPYSDTHLNSTITTQIPTSVMPIDCRPTFNIRLITSSSGSSSISSLSLLSTGIVQLQIIESGPR